MDVVLSVAYSIWCSLITESINDDPETILQSNEVEVCSSEYLMPYTFILFHQFRTGGSIILFAIRLIWLILTLTTFTTSC